MKISILTATFNCASQLPALIRSVETQTDTDFEWIVADGGSTDETLGLLAQVQGIDLKVSSQPDFGIYDALNRALRMASGTYYVVVGADDALYHDALVRYREAIAVSGADIIVARARCGDYCRSVRSGPRWIHGVHTLIANHSLATAFRLGLHEKFGLYSRKLPIAADALFVLQACQGGAVCYDADFIAGDMGPGGVSAVDWAGSATEFFRVQLLTGCALLPQLFLLALRIWKGSSRSVRGLFGLVRAGRAR